MGGGTLTDGGGYWEDGVGGAPKTERGYSTVSIKRHEQIGEKNSNIKYIKSHNRRQKGINRILYTNIVLVVWGVDSGVC